jgi:hypothetical protein
MPNVVVAFFVYFACMTQIQAAPEICSDWLKRGDCLRQWIKPQGIAATLAMRILEKDQLAAAIAMESFHVCDVSSIKVKGNAFQEQQECFSGRLR